MMAVRNRQIHRAAQNNALRVLQLNIRSVTRRRSNLLKRLTERNIDIAALQETWLQPGQSFHLPGFSTVERRRQNRRGGGAALCIRHGIAFTPFATPAATDDFEVAL